MDIDDNLKVICWRWKLSKVTLSYVKLPQVRGSQTFWYRDPFKIFSKSCDPIFFVSKRYNCNSTPPNNSDLICASEVNTYLVFDVYIANIDADSRGGSVRVALRGHDIRPHRQSFLAGTVHQIKIKFCYVELFRHMIENIS